MQCRAGQACVLRWAAKWVAGFAVSSCWCEHGGSQCWLLRCPSEKRGRPPCFWPLTACRWLVAPAGYPIHRRANRVPAIPAMLLPVCSCQSSRARPWSLPTAATLPNPNPLLPLCLLSLYPHTYPYPHSLTPSRPSVPFCDTVTSLLLCRILASRSLRHWPPYSRSPFAIAFRKHRTSNTRLA